MPTQKLPKPRYSKFTQTLFYLQHDLGLKSATARQIYDAQDIASQKYGEFEPYDSYNLFSGNLSSNIKKRTHPVITRYQEAGLYHYQLTPDEFTKISNHIISQHLNKNNNG